MEATMYLDMLTQLWNDGTIYFMLGAAVVISNSEFPLHNNKDCDRLGIVHCITPVNTGWR